MPHKRKTENSNNSPSAKIDEKIENLIPMDMWLYKYAQRLFQARWKWFKTGIYLEPTYPPYPGKASVGRDNVLLTMHINFRNKMLVNS